MKLRKSIVSVLCALCLLSALVLTGCGQQENGDILEEPEITVEYLSGEYADQLIRDGGEKILGSVDGQKESDGTILLQVDSKAIVENADYEKGYYIADKNVSQNVPLSSEARITYIADKKPAVISADKFFKALQKDKHDKKVKLYEVYVIAGNAELVLAKELK